MLLVSRSSNICTYCTHATRGMERYITHSHIYRVTFQGDGGTLLTSGSMSSGRDYLHQKLCKNLIVCVPLTFTIIIELNQKV